VKSVHESESQPSDILKTIKDCKSERDTERAEKVSRKCIDDFTSKPFQILL